VAAQNLLGKASFLSNANKVNTMTTAQVHHIFPKHYLVKNGFERSDYNNIANFAYLRDDINIKVSDEEPTEYMAKVKEYKGAYGSDINSDKLLDDNLSENAIPRILLDATHKEFFQFMDERRKLMAQIVKNYYKNL
jgi:hypothetical protein